LADLLLQIVYALLRIKEEKIFEPCLLSRNKVVKYETK